MQTATTRNPNIKQALLDAGESDVFLHQLVNAAKTLTNSGQITNSVQNQISSNGNTRYATIKQLAILRPVFTEAALRDIAFKADDRKNSRGEIIEGNGSGSAGVWLKLGAKRLADIPAFDRWIESHKMKGAR